MLWGRTGVGKSASGNTILGKIEFRSVSSSASTTMECNRANGKRGGKDLVVVDTPGAMNTKMSHSEVMEAFLSSIENVHPHIFLYVLKPNEFSRQDLKILEAFIKIFEGALHHTIFLFTHGDLVPGVEEIIRDSGLVEGEIPYHVFNNESQDDSQAESLLKKIDDLVKKNEGEHYSKEDFEEAVDTFEEIMQSALAANPPPDFFDRLLKDLEEVAPGLSTVRAILKLLENVAGKLIE